MTLAPEIPADPTDPAWIEARRTFIGASDAPAVLGISPWATPLDVWADKLNVGTRFAGNLATDMGHALEDMIAREWLRLHPGWTMKDPKLTIRHPVHSHIAASMDREVYPPESVYDEGGTAARCFQLVECKYVGPTTAWQWANGVPVYVQAQAQVQMAVTGARRCHVAALIVDYGPKFYTQVIERDDAVIDEIIGRLNTFWQQHIEQGERPDTDGMDPEQVRRRLEDMYRPPAEAKAERLPHELAQVCADIKRAKALKKDLGAQIADAENQLRTWMIDNDVTDAFIDDNAKPAVTWRTIKRKGHTVAASEYQKLTVA